MGSAMAEGGASVAASRLPLVESSSVTARGATRTGQEPRPTEDSDVSAGSGFHSSFGRQNLRRQTVAKTDEREATMSTSHGPWKLETRNWGMAKATPAVKAAGQTPSSPRKPAIAQT